MTDSNCPLTVPEYTVSELSSALKTTVEEKFGFVRVRGEVSELNNHSSGHCYLSLKDDSSSIKAIIWRTGFHALSHKPEIGMEIIVSGRLTTYAPRSSYQLIIQTLEMAGEGALLKLLEDRRKALEAEGLFDAALKKNIPSYPGIIGVVTSATGSVIRDILHRLKERFPTRVLVWPVSVQGEGAPYQIASAIKGFNNLPELGNIPRPNLLIVARGGGSLEDLWAFNDETVVRSTAESSIPIISAIGHETDTTLIDFAADRRAPTPTAAAEISVPVRFDLITKITECSFRMDRAVSRSIKEKVFNFSALSRALPNYSDIMERRTQDIDRLSERLIIAPSRFILAKELQFKLVHERLSPAILFRDFNLFSKNVKDSVARMVSAFKALRNQREEKLIALFSRLESVSHLSVVGRGYVIVRDTKDYVVTKKSGLSNGKKLILGFSDGQVLVSVDDTSLD